VTRPDFLDLLDAPARRGEAVRDAWRSVVPDELDHDVRVMAAGLADRGVGAGDRVAAVLGNNVEAIELYLACALLGAIWVGVNPNAPEKERERQFCLVTPRLIITDNESHGDVMVLELATHDRRHRDLTRPTLDAPCAIAFTSGTTADPKAVVHSRAAVSLAAASLAHNRITDHDRVGVILPLSIHNLVVVGAIAPLLAGARVVVVRQMNAAGVAEACREHQLSLMTALVPATIHDLVHDDTIDADSLATLRYAGTGAAGLSEDLRLSFEAKFGVQLRGSYGMTEAPGPVTMEDVNCAHRPGRSGTTLPHVAITVDGRDQLAVTAVTRGPWADMFRPPLGTWTEQGLRAWPDARTLWTGDRGSVDPDGQVCVIGRDAATIVRGGVNVGVDELESLLSALPEVRGLAVVGWPDQRLGERIVAFVEPQPGAICDVGSLRERSASLLSRTKVPDEFVVIEALPRNAMGKSSGPAC
jgi:malonyl-CoA/methylmalonyl-CoA synthetase